MSCDLDPRRFPQNPAVAANWGVGQRGARPAARLNRSAGRGLRSLLGLGALVLGLLTGAGSQAAPVLLQGSSRISTDAFCVPYCGLEAKAAILGNEGAWADGQYSGGAGANTSAVVGGGGFTGKNAAAVAQVHWTSTFKTSPGQPTDEPIHLHLDLDLGYFASHDAMFGLGQASGGASVKIALWRCRPNVLGAPFCLPVFGHKLSYHDSFVFDDVLELGLFDPLDIGLLDLTFEVGSVVQTFPIIGIGAHAIDMAVMGFTLRADDGQSPPAPLSEPASAALVLGALGLAAGFRRRRAPTA